MDMILSPCDFFIGYMDFRTTFTIIDYNSAAHSRRRRSRA
jgi:hypothetical protein